ncbi:hypothetical protein [Halorubrum laminariae]|uniref:3-keto-disaccharide hydrolase domain-containing protein n=1 Tax=Halorubrum laminariae TaxID=1433523 RepID=A0ABD6C0H4_9EURY|nr:hypothetical protein [Halorubrum laminariae]
MTDGSSRFTSDRRTRMGASWTEQADWEAGTTENVGLLADRLVGRPPSEGSGTQTRVVDDFDEVLYEGEGKALSDYYSNDVSQFTRRSGGVHEGGYVLEGSHNGGQSNFWMVSYEGDGLDYPQEGDTFSYWNWVDKASIGGNAGNIFWGYDENDGTRFNLRLNRGNSDFYVYAPDGTVIIDRVSYSYPASAWEEWEIQWLPNEIVVTVYDRDGNEQTSVSGSHNSSRTSGGVGYYVGANRPIVVRIDNVGIK